MPTSANDNGQLQSPEKRAAKQFLDEYLRPAGEIEASWSALVSWYESLRGEHRWWPEMSMLSLPRLLKEMGCTIRLHLPPRAEG
jgi:hypothetical protein